MLTNKLGIKSESELAREEERISKKRAAELFESGYLDTLEAGTFESLSKIHASKRKPSCMRRRFECKRNVEEPSFGKIHLGCIMVCIFPYAGIQNDRTRRYARTHTNVLSKQSDMFRMWISEQESKKSIHQKVGMS